MKKYVENQSFFCTEKNTTLLIQAYGICFYQVLNLILDIS